MLDPYLEMARLALFALVIGLVIFGGTTLGYFLDKHRKDSPTPVLAQPLDRRSERPETGERR